MIKYGALRGARLRRHRRLLLRVQRGHFGLGGPIYVRAEAEFRMAERLHRAGLITAAVSRHNWFGFGNPRRPYRELALFARDAEARRQYPCIMER